MIKFTMRQNCLIVSVTGDIDQHNASSVREQIDLKISHENVRKVIFDFSNLDFMDSSGLGLIMGRLAKTKEIGASLVLRNPSARVTRMIKMAGLDRVIQTTKT